MTGDASVNADAPIICCTAEILANIALRDGADADVGQVVMDEFHFYADPDRGWAWQVPLIELPEAQFLLMSATLGDVSRFEARPDPAHRPADRRRCARAVRPVPLFFSYALTPLHETIEELLDHQAGAGLRRALHPGRRARAGAGADEHQRLHPGGEGRDRRRDRRLPVHRRLRQDAVPASSGTASACTTPGCCRSTAGWWSGWPRPACSRSICGTDTLGVGINVPIRTVLFTALSKYDGSGRGCSRPASSTRSPAGPGGPASTPPARSSCRRPSTWSRTRRRWPRPATTRRSGARWSARSRRRASIGWGEPTFERLVDGRAGAADLAASGCQPRDAAQRHRPARRRVRRDAAPAARQPRGPAGPAPAHPARRSPSTASLLAAGVVERLSTPDADGPDGAARPSTCRTTSPSTSRCRRSRWPRSSCSTGSRRTYAARRRVGHRVHAGRPAAGAVGAAAQGPRRGGRGDEGRGHRVRGADGAARGGHLPEAAGGAAARPRTRRTGAGTRGWPTTS